MSVKLVEFDLSRKQTFVVYFVNVFNETILVSI